MTNFTTSVTSTTTTAITSRTISRIMITFTTIVTTTTTAATRVTNAAFDFSSFSGSSISVDNFVRRNSLGGYELSDIQLVGCGAGDNASDYVLDVAHGGGGCDPTIDHSTIDHSSRYRCGGNQRARECPIGNNCGGGGSGCYNCGEGDHYARDCPA
nr:hypothetical protein [Tanacetum cinerariifolium]